MGPARWIHRRATWSAPVANKEAAVETALVAIRALVAQAKNSRNYTGVIGSALAWITPGSSFDPSLYTA